MNGELRNLLIFFAKYQYWLGLFLLRCDPKSLQNSPVAAGWCPRDATLDGWSIWGKRCFTFMFVSDFISISCWLYIVICISLWLYISYQFYTSYSFHLHFIWLPLISSISSLPVFSVEGWPTWWSIRWPVTKVLRRRDRGNPKFLGTSSDDVVKAYDSHDRFIWSSIGAMSHHISTSYAIRVISLQQKIANIFPRFFCFFCFFKWKFTKEVDVFLSQWYWGSADTKSDSQDRGRSQVGSVFVIFVTVWWKDSESASVCGPFWGQIAIWLTMCAKGCEELRILVRWHGRLKFSFLVPWKHWNLPTLPGCSQWMRSGIPSHLQGALIVMVRSIDFYLYDRSLPCMSWAAVKHIEETKPRWISAEMQQLFVCFQFLQLQCIGCFEFVCTE